MARARPRLGPPTPPPSNASRDNDQQGNDAQRNGWGDVIAPPVSGLSMCIVSRASGLRGRAALGDRPRLDLVSLYEDVYAALRTAEVRFVVVGGMAVVLSGHVRATVDLDVVVDLAPDAARRAVMALTDLGFQPRVP